jgi:hypothetical protein
VEVNATFPGAFHRLSAAIMVSFLAYPLSAVLQYKFIIIFTFINLFYIHISEFATVLGQSSYFYKLGETRCYNSLPLKGTSSSMFYLSTCHACLDANKIGYACFMASSISHVASSGPKCFHCTLTCAMVRFQSEVSFLSNMHWGFGRNSPSGST